MLFLLSGAFALDCTGLDADLCSAVNQITLDVNALTGASTLDDGASRVGLRPITLYNRLLEVQTSLPPAEGCVVTGYVSGTYDTADGSVDGTWRDFDTSNGSLDASFTPASKRFAGNFSGDRSDRVGNGFGRYNAGRQLAGNWSNEFVAGVFERNQGGRGVHMSIRGTCDGLITEALDPWWSGGLDALIAPLRVFVTTPYDAVSDPRPFTGIAGLDQRCQDEADAVFGLGETTFVAAVTDLANGVDSPDQRTELEIGRPLVQSVNGRWLGLDIAGFFNPFVNAQAPVNVQADGTTFAVNVEAFEPDNAVWWGDYGPTGPSASNTLGDCDGWSNALSASGVVAGVPFTAGPRVLRWGADCDDIQGRSYCVEVD